MDHAAHHPKSDVATEHELRMACLRCQWRERQQKLQAGAFVPVDPRTPEAAEEAMSHYARRIHAAGAFLARIKANEQNRAEAEAQRLIEVTGRRALFQVIQGGRL